MSGWLWGIVTMGQDVFDGPEVPGGAGAWLSLGAPPHAPPRTIQETQNQPGSGLLCPSRHVSPL